MTTFFRLLKTDIDKKGEMLAAQIAARNAGETAAETFVVEPKEFKQVPGTPFGYWVEHHVRTLFSNLPPFEDDETVARVTNPTADNFRFLRNYWECVPARIDRKKDWVPYAKGGAGKRFFADVNLVVAWDDVVQTYRGYKGTVHRPDLRPANLEFFFRPGIMWPIRAAQLSAQAFPTGTTFSARSQCLFAPNEKLSYYLALLNSSVIDFLFKIALGRFGFPEFVVGILRNLPKPVPDSETFSKLHDLGNYGYETLRLTEIGDETSHAFCLPSLAQNRQSSLRATYQLVQEKNSQAQARLAEIQNEIDEIVAGLYGLKKEDYAEVESVEIESGEQENAETEDDEEEENSTSIENRPNGVGEKSEIENLFLWCVGCAVGRWDVRFALDPTLLPKLQDLFDPLPRCSPGMLVGTDGLPATPDNIVSEAWLRARPNVITLPTESNSVSEQSEQEEKNLQSPISNLQYPLQIDWDGILTDDPDHGDDIVRRVRDVLALLWGERADEIEQEACEILGVASLREYFRQPKHFFDFHIKRYSKSRRKAPIYWLLQSAKKNYGLWLYYHRLTPDTLFKAHNKYVNPKINLENIKLNDLRAQLTPDLSARERREIEKVIAKQQAFISELTDFAKELKHVAELYLAPDLNDGVIISIAPLHNLVPWKEAEKMWNELAQGKYAWSTMGQKMRAKGLVKKK